MDLMETGVPLGFGVRGSVHLVAAQLGFGRKESNLQLVGAIARLVHAMALFEQLEELLNGNARVGWAP